MVNSAVSDPATTSKSSPRRGRRANVPTTALGTWLQQRLDALSITRIEFARRLHVSPSTVGRLLNGDTRVVQRVSAEGICRALELGDMDRREFLRLMGVASAETFAFATGATTPRVQKYKVDLDLANDHANALSRLLDRGEAAYVRESAQLWYDKLTQDQPYVKDIQLGAVQIRFGIQMGAAQEFTLPWHQRSQVAIETYTALEEDVICRYDLKTFRQEYAIVLSHRAPLYRSTGRFHESERDFENAIYWVKTVDDPQLRANLLRSRAHLMVVQNDELRWRRAIEEARKDTYYLSAYRQESLQMIDYTEGEGLKRLAFSLRKELPIAKRKEYALRALDSFKQSNHGVELVISQHLLTQVSEAQCLIWIDPEEAIRRVELLWNETSLYFPALLDKMKRTVQMARKRLMVRPGEPLPLFHLDARF